MLISQSELLAKMDPALLNSLREVTNGTMILPEKEQLKKRLQNVQAFVENFCIRPIQKETDVAAQPDPKRDEDLAAQESKSVDKAKTSKQVNQVS